MAHAAGKMSAPRRVCEAFRRTGDTNPRSAAMPAHAAGVARQRTSGNVRRDILVDFDKDAGGDQTEVTYAETSAWTRRRSGLSGNGGFRDFISDQKILQHDMQSASLQKTQADELHSHAAAHMHAANDGARLHFTLRRIKK